MAALALEQARLGELRRLVDTNLAGLLPDPGDPPHRLHAAMRYAVLSPGKRIRPLLALLTASHLGCPLSSVMPGACALELVHAASLVLDDLPCMDDSDDRRGQPSLHVRYGEDIAVLTGVALLNEAFAVIGRAPGLPEAARLQMIALLSRTVGAGLIAGQEKDLRASGDISLGYVSELHHEKTGMLFIASVEMGALAAGADAWAVEALRRFGSELGYAFQALDDLEDEDEVAAGKATMLSVLGRERLRQEAARRLEAARSALTEGGSDLAQMAAYLDVLLGR